MQSTALKEPDELAIHAVNDLIVQEAHSIAITSEQEYLSAVEFTKKTKARISEVKDQFKEVKQAAKNTHSRICDMERKALERLEQAFQVVNKMLIDYIETQKALERKRQEEEKKLAEERARKEAEERALMAAIELEQMGANAEAAEFLEQPIQNIIPIVATVQSFIPKTKGFYSTEVYSSVVENFKDLIIAVAQGKAPMACIKADQSFLDKQASALKTELNYPGVKVMKSTRTTTRR